MSGITRRHGYNFQHVEVGNLLLEAHGCQWRIHLVRASFEDREAGWYVHGLGIADPASKAGDYCATMDEAIRHAAELADQVKANQDAAGVPPGMTTDDEDDVAEKVAALSPGAAAILTNMVAEAIEVDAAAIELQALLGDQLALHAGMTEARHRYATSGMTLAACIRSVARDVKAGDWPTAHDTPR